MIINMGCNHKFKIIRTEIGKEHGLFTSQEIMIYHLQCEKCGDVTSREAPIVCRKCANEITEKKEKTQ